MSIYSASYSVAMVFLHSHIDFTLRGHKNTLKNQLARRYLILWKGSRMFYCGYKLERISYISCQKRSLKGQYQEEAEWSINHHKIYLKILNTS